MAESHAEQAFREQSGQAWARLSERTDAQLDAFGRAALTALAVQPGESVLDVGCGCGQTLLQLAELVGPRGHVSGLDVSEPMLELARARCASLPQVELVLANAATHALPAARFDALFSRFGVMFFEDATAAFTNLRRALAPGGRLAFTCWQALAHNPWAHVPLAAAQRALPAAPLPALLDPEQPGAFFFSDPARVERILRAAGFSAPRVEPLRLRTPLGGARTLGEAVDYVCQIGPTSRLLGEAGAVHDPAVRGALRAALGEHVTPEGVVLSGAAFVVTAQNG